MHEITGPCYLTHQGAHQGGGNVFAEVCSRVTI